MSLQAGSLFSLEGRTVLLTGATGFLGRTFARALLSNGARLIALGRSDRLDALTAEWKNEFGEEHVLSERIDMYDLPAFSAFLDEVATQEAVDVLINNAYELGPNTGFNTREGALEAATLEQWTRHFTSGVYLAGPDSSEAGPGHDHAWTRQHRQHLDDVRGGRSGPAPV